MANPSDHELNEVLARVLGLRWGYCPETNEHGYFDAEDNFRYPERTFDPLHDANQMELAEAWLRENGWEYISGWSRQGSNHWAELRNTKKAFWSCDPDKKRAFALAVYAMAQSQEGTT